MGNSIAKCELTEESTNYLFTNTEFGDEEIQQWYIGFTQDYPKDRITLEEYGKMFKGLFKDDKSSDQMITVHFESYDRYEKGYLDFARFLMSLSDAVFR